MRFTPTQFRRWQYKAITLCGMSGVGKTFVSTLLRNNNWFHFSGDYRIATRYLDEAIGDQLKRDAMAVPSLQTLLHSDSICIMPNVTIDNLLPVSHFLGKLGDPKKGGIGFEEFKHRQSLHRTAEIAAMKDVPEFIERSRYIYRYSNFVNDAGGSICELEDDSVLRVLAEHTLILCIEASHDDEEVLIERARRCPKPLFYRRDFLESHVATYLSDFGIVSPEMIDPDDFARWVFPKLIEHRRPLYRDIAERYGYTVQAADLKSVNDEQGFLEVVTEAIGRHSDVSGADAA